jgi:thioredoxin-like negative regulator of GroEL
VLAELVALTDDPHHAETLQALWSAPDAHYLLGQALLAQGRPRQAAQVLGALVERLEDFRDARVLLAAALGETGALDAGAEQYLEAMTRGIEPLLAEDSIVKLFRRWSAAHPERFEAQLYAARVLHHHGYFREALTRLEALEVPFERWKEVEEEKARLRRALEFVPEPEGTMPPP